MPDYTTIIESGSLGISTIATNLSTTSVAVAVGFIGATGPIGSGFDLNGPNNGLITRDGLEGNVAVAEAGFTYDPNGTGYLSGKFGINTNNPTFTLDVVGSGNFSSGVYGSSVSIGTTTSTALLTVGNNSSTIAASGLAFGNDSGANLYRSASSTVKTDGNFLAMGNVGIGTATPLYKLDVNGTAQVDVLRIGYSTNQGTITYGSGLGMVVRSASSQPLSLGAAGRNSDITILPTGGSVGIGLTTPDLRLHVEGVNAYPASTGTTPSGFLILRAKAASATHGMYMGVANASPWGSWIQCGDSSNLATNYPLLLNPNGGNVGIGTTAPQAPLHVTGSAANAFIIERTTAGSNINMQFKNATASWYAGQTDGGAFGIGTTASLGSSSIFNIKTNGSVGIGTTTPGVSLEINSANQLRLKQSDAGGAYFDFISTSTGHGAGLGKFVITYNGGSTSTPPFAIDISGNVGIGTSTPASKLSLATHTAASGGITFGTDTNLYRSSTATIKTDGNLIVAQNLTVTNHLSAATKSFLICHPSEKGKMLQYGSLESPYHGIRLTGKNKLINNSIIINLPSYISNLVSEEGINIQITNINHDKVLYVKQINIKENNFVVGVSCLLSSECEFYWSFTAIRKDVPMLEVEYQLKYG